MVIYFIGNTSSNYGRGKDKAKRKSRVGTISGAAGGLATGLLAGKTLTSGAIGALAGTGAGMLIDRDIDKQKERYKKSGPLSLNGKVNNDVISGVKSLGITGAGLGTLGGLAASKGLKKKALWAGIGAGLGGMTGAGVGTLGGLASGAIRAKVQPNKKKKGKNY